jgi:hypothetical protein
MNRQTHGFGFGNIELLIDRLGIIIFKVASVVSLVLMLIKLIEVQILSW